MVEKSSLVIILVLSFVLALSFKDLMTIKVQASSKQSGQKANNELNLNEEERKEFQETLRTDDDVDASENQSDDEPLDGETVKKIPQLKIKKNVQTLKFQFCYSCGYRNMFEQYSQIIRQRYPDINVIGENYQPPGGRAYIAQFLSTFKLVIIGLILFGQNPFPYLNMNTPQIFVWATENKLYACLMLFFISNTIETQLISTGAFEIYLNDLKIWSKLDSDRMPHEKELIQILDVNFNFDSAKNEAFGAGAGNFNPNDAKF